VNAASLASERGLTVHEERKPKAPTGGVGSVLSIAIKTQKATHVVKGAVVREDTPRLLHVDGIEVEAQLEQNLIYMRNQDVPGVIGKVGTILGKHGINIANFSLGRRHEEPAPGVPREAIAVVQVDGSVPEAVVSELCGVPAVLRAKAVKLD
jgi:D-3-phosphoglycerate dehydrogenase